jgi:chitin synthase
MDTQYTEYKFSHYLDKAYESLFGFVTVLPGAFATFRYAALEGSPLSDFLKGLSKDAQLDKIPSPT